MKKETTDSKQTTSLTSYLGPNPDTISIMVTSSWYIRLWRLVSNPFLYVFTGKIRY